MHRATKLLSLLLPLLKLIGILTPSPRFNARFYTLSNILKGRNCNAARFLFECECENS